MSESGDESEVHALPLSFQEGAERGEAQIALILFTSFWIFTRFA